ncbi:hypothetical protein RSAG8_05956, partial [Rhizoctonia solani AG-8 WAC10335]
MRLNRVGALVLSRWEHQQSHLGTPRQTAPCSNANGYDLWRTFFIGCRWASQGSIARGFLDRNTLSFISWLSAPHPRVAVILP